MIERDRAGDTNKNISKKAVANIGFFGLDANNAAEYVVDRVVNHTVNKRKLFYCVRWFENFVDVDTAEVAKKYLTTPPAKTETGILLKKSFRREVLEFNVRKEIRK